MSKRGKCRDFPYIPCVITYWLYLKITLVNSCGLYFLQIWTNLNGRYPPLCIQKVFPALSKSFVPHIFFSHPPFSIPRNFSCVYCLHSLAFFSRIDLFHPSVIVNFLAGETKDLTKAIYMIKNYTGSEFEYEGREDAVVEAGHTCPSWERSEMTHAQGPVSFCPPQWTLSHRIKMHILGEPSSQVNPLWKQAPILWHLLLNWLVLMYVRVWDFFLMHFLSMDLILVVPISAIF